MWVCCLWGFVFLLQKPLPPRNTADTGLSHEFRLTVLLDAERRVANHIIRRYGTIGKALRSFDRNRNGMVRERSHARLPHCFAWP